MFYLSSSILIKSQRDKFTLILRSYPFSGRERRPEIQFRGERKKHAKSICSRHE